MSEKYELNINIDDSGDSDGTERAGRKADRSNLFAKPRTRSRKFSMDVFDVVKDRLGDKAYKRILKKAKESGMDEEDAKEKAKQGRFAVGYGIKEFTSLSSRLITTSTSNIGTFTSNQTSQNYVDNIASSVTGVLSAVGTIGAGAAAGGIVGAAIATVGVTANKALEIANSAMKLAKDNITRNEESTRVRNRLGYIESGYSR